MEYLLSAQGWLPRTIDLNVFSGDPSEEASGSRHLPQGSADGEATIAVALHFNEDQVLPLQIEREAFRQLLRVVPEYRRDLRVSVRSLVVGGASPTDVALRVVAGRPGLWTTMSVPAMEVMLRSMNVAVAVVHGLQPAQARDLHDLMNREATGYQGAVQVDLDLDVHRRLYQRPARYRLIEAELRLLYSAAEYGPGWDTRPHDLCEEWQAHALFDRITWEEDESQSAADLDMAEEVMDAFLRDHGGMGSTG